MLMKDVIIFACPLSCNALLAILIIMNPRAFCLTSSRFYSVWMSLVWNSKGRVVSGGMLQVVERGETRSFWGDDARVDGFSAIYAGGFVFDDAACFSLT
jgi:hypothetical protein